MHQTSFIWDSEDDPEGNYWHIVVEGHGITREEVEEVLSDPANPTEESRSSGYPITTGWTYLGRRIKVVWEFVMEDPRTAYPITAFPDDPSTE